MGSRLRNLGPEEVDRLGEFCADLLNEGRQWVFRRRESLTVLDESTVRRRQSVDFSLDEIAPMVEREALCSEVFGPNVWVAPLYMLGKDPSSTLAFDLNDESGATLSLATTEENCAISAATLIVICRRRLGVDELLLPETLRSKLEALALSPPAEARAWLDRLRDPLPDDPDRLHLPCLFDSGQTEWWIETMAEYSIVMVTFDGSNNHRRVIKIAYEQPMQNNPTFPALLAIRSFRARVTVPLMTGARYHFDVKAPPELKLTQLALIDSKSTEPNRAAGRSRWSQIYEDEVDDARSALVQFGLRVSGRGELGGALVAALLVVVALLACLYLRTTVVEGSTAGPALLLVLPGIIATYVARGDAHALSTRLLAWPRWILLLGSGVTAYFAAGVIALNGSVESLAALAQRMPLKKAEPRHSALVAEHAQRLYEWLRMPFLIAAAAGLIIFLGWFCTRTTVHWVLRQFERLGDWCGTLVSTWFTFVVEMRAPTEEVRRRLEEEIGRFKEPMLLEELEIDWAEPERDECAIVRSLFGFSWTHQIRLTESPEGTNLLWEFSAKPPDGLGSLAPFLVLLALWERMMIRLRIALFRRAWEH